MMKKCRDWKEKVNFKLYDVTALLTNIYYIYCPIPCKVKERRQNMLVSQQNKIIETFLKKNHAENKTERIVPDHFFLIKKA